LLSLNLNGKAQRKTANNVAGTDGATAFIRHSFYEGTFAESVRIAAILRVLVHETGKSKPLLRQAQPNGLDLPILEHAGEWSSEEVFFSFAVSARMGVRCDSSGRAIHGSDFINEKARCACIPAGRVRITKS